MKTDREMLIGTLRFGSSQAYSIESKKDCEEFADYLISKGVTIPVRCWECEYYREEKGICSNPAVVKSYYGCKVKKDGFCSYGERKEE